MKTKLDLVIHELEKNKEYVEFYTDQVRLSLKYTNDGVTLYEVTTEGAFKQKILTVNAKGEVVIHQVNYENQQTD